MTIEFADPGYNWAFLLYPLIALAVGLVLFFLPFFLVGEESRKWRDWYPVPGLILCILSTAGLILGGPLSSSAYSSNVREAKVQELNELGLKSINFEGDSFTADKDGAFFYGALIDLHPSQDYAFEVVELTAKD